MKTKVLQLLEKNALYTPKDLADLLNEDPDLIADTVNQFEKDGIIVGYHTIINWDKADTEITKAIIFVNCVPERETGYDKVANAIARYPEVDSLSLISGKAEFLLIVNGRNMREVSNFVAHKLAPTEGVNGTETMFILKEYKTNGMMRTEDKEDGERLLVTP